MLGAEGNVTTTHFRQFGFAVSILCLAGAYWFGADPTDPAVLSFLAASLALALIAAFAPGRLRVPFVLSSALTAPIGWVVSHLILGLIFFGVVTPIGILLRVVGRLPMDLEIDREATSYWSPRKAPANAKDYLRQS